MYPGCDDMNTVGVMSSRVDVMSYVVLMMSYILWLRYDTYNLGCMIDNLVVITEI